MVTGGVLWELALLYFDPTLMVIFKSSGDILDLCFLCCMVWGFVDLLVCVVLEPFAQKLVFL